MKALTPAALTQTSGLTAYSALPSRRSDLNHASRPMVAFHSRLSASGCSRLRHHPAGSPRVCAESGSCSYGPTVRLRPRLAATQLPSATKLRHALPGTRTPQTRRPRGRTRSPEQARPKGNQRLCRWRLHLRIAAAKSWTGQPWPSPAKTSGCSLCLGLRNGGTLRSGL